MTDTTKHMTTVVVYSDRYKEDSLLELYNKAIGNTPPQYVSALRVGAEEDGNKCTVFVYYYREETEEETTKRLDPRMPWARRQYCGV